MEGAERIGAGAMERLSLVQEEAGVDVSNAVTAGVAVRASPGRGMGLYATRAYPDAGTEVLLETPLLLVSARQIQAAENVAAEQRSTIDAAAWAAYHEFLRAPDSVKEAFFGLYSPTDGRLLDGIRVLATRGMTRLSEAEAGDDAHEAVEEFQSLLGDSS